MKELKCEELDLLAYLSGSLNTQDHEAVHRHLAWCAACRSELELLEEATKVLPAVLEPISPPDTLRTQVLNEAFRVRPPVAAVRNLVQPGSKGTDGGVTESRNVGSRAVGSRNRWDTASRKLDSKTRWPHKRLFGRLLPWSVSVVLFVVCLALTQNLLTETHRVTALKQELVHTATTVALRPTQYLQGASGRVVIIPAKNGVKLIVSVSNAKPTLGAQVYHVWLLNHGQRKSAGTLTVNRQGVGVLQVALNGAKAKFDAIGITLEPSAMTKVPTGPKVLGANKL
ncbi:anti-sigma factor [Alicyclobacillus mengziensis]|uniref:Regulator of SigK n=1 Tax=Alicyclobacillus mengziensis TaxID=2931921 RepID=A0A9X7W2W1_9BACL|nr:anti-sigma factor [Alicyclobacillus mengziensis]QSO49656.1 anti-sigma factor [Alicyclobacillus mengziensis]